MTTKLLSILLLIIVCTASSLWAAPSGAESKTAVVDAARPELLTLFKNTLDPRSATELVEVALERNIDPFAVFALALEAGFSASDIIYGAINSGMSKPAIVSLARAVGIPMEELVQILGPQELEGLGYTPDSGDRPRSVGHANGNPGGSARGGTASPSTL